MAIAAADVKKLREATGAGMMDCKRALEESEGDFDKAVEALRIAGAAKSAKRGAERTASSGLVTVATTEGATAVVELNSETDFVAKNTDFVALADKIAMLAAHVRATDATALSAVDLEPGVTVAQAVEAASAVIGEKLALGRVAVLIGDVAVYQHRRAQDLPPQVGVLVAYSGDSDAARGAAMQVAAMRPQFTTRDEIPAETVENERRIAEATARDEGKPEAALLKIVEGRLTGFYKDTVLLEQPSVVDSKRTVKAVLADSGTTVSGFVRIEVGQR